MASSWCFLLRIPGGDRAEAGYVGRALRVGVWSLGLGGVVDGSGMDLGWMGGVS